MSTHYFQQVAVQRSIQDVINDFERVEMMVNEAYRLLDSAEQIANTHKINVKANVHNRMHFHPDAAIERMRRDAWIKLMDMTGLKQIMDTKALEEFEKELYSKAPAFTEENIRGTLLQQMQESETMFARGLVNVFRALSGKYRRHEDAAFRIPKKIIIGYATDYWTKGRIVVSHSAYSRLDDIDRIFKTLAGEKFKPHELIAALGTSWQSGDMHECELYKARGFKNGNMHIEFMREDLLEKANDIIAKWYGTALGATRK